MGRYFIAAAKYSFLPVIFVIFGISTCQGQSTYDETGNNCDSSSDDNSCELKTMQHRLDEFGVMLVQQQNAIDNLEKEIKRLQIFVQNDVFIIWYIC